MSTSSLQAILEQVRAGTLPVAEAERLLGRAGMGDLDYARVDLERPRRCGFAEVIYCEGKTSEWVEGVARRLEQAGQNCLATRVSPEQAEHLARVFPEAEQDRLARTFWRPLHPPEPLPGRVAVLTAGTSDLPVAQEAVITARCLGCQVELVSDVGVAGLHRLLRHREVLQRSDVIIVVAGMDGALPSVVGGLVDSPVIAVPTSVGYGAAFAGVAPLLTALNSCSSGVLVVNIDSGFKAGFCAAVMLRRLKRA
jgi:NCAIR mutase (PurE)-related protein